MDLNKTNGAQDVNVQNAKSNDTTQDVNAQNANAKKSEKKSKAGGLKFDKLFKFFSKAGIKKFVLILYCVVPLLIVSVGFAAWTIIGNDVQSGSGTFNAYGIINSYDYIELQTTNIGAIDFYATGFVKDNVIVKTYAFDITYKVNMTMCANLLKSKSTTGTLTAEFEFCFNSGTEDYSAFFKNLSCQVIVNKANTEPLTVPKSSKTIDGVGTITYASEDKDNNNHKLTTLYIEPKCNTTEDKTADWTENSSQNIIELKLTYTLDPTLDKANGNDYQELYNLVSSLSNEKPMIDVRITD